MKPGWEVKRLGEVVQIVNGGTPKTDNPAFWDGGVPWITPKDLGRIENPSVSVTSRTLSDLGLRQSSAKLLPVNSVILSTRAPIGHLAINDVPMATNQGCRGLVPGKQLDARYLLHFLASRVDLLNDLGVGTTFKELAAGVLASVELPLPPLAEQRRIVEVLDEAFEGLATATVNAEQTLANARELFVSELSKIVADALEFHEPSVLADLATDITDGDHSPPPKAMTGVPFITIGDVNKRTRLISFDDTFKVPHAYFEALKPNKKARTGDVLYTVTGSFGIPVLITDEPDFCFQRHIGLIRPKATTDSRWLYYLLLSPQLIKQAMEAATGTAQKTVSLGALRKMVVPQVTPSLQQAFVRRLDALASAVEDYEVSVMKKRVLLAELKQSLLNRAFSGQLV